MKGNQIELPVTARKTGKHHARAARKHEMVPGVLYGNNVKNVNVSAEAKLIKKYTTSAFENTIFTLKSDVAGLDKTPVLIKSLDVHPVNRRPVHFDMYVVDMNKAVRVFVELRFEGKAAGFSEGGVLQPLMRQLELECLPKDIPTAITIDITNLGLFQTLHVSEIALPNGVKPVSKEDLALVTITVIEEEAAPVAAAAPTAEGAAAAAAPTEPEVIKKGKKEEEGAAGEAKAEKK